MPSTAAFLGFRRDLASRMERVWLLAVLESERRRKPDLDLVLTHVDDRFDKNISKCDRLGCDAPAPLFTFLIEDPATGLACWGAEIQRNQGELPGADDSPGKAGDRSQYRRAIPECLSRQAAHWDGTSFKWCIWGVANFGQVALHFENSFLVPDWRLLARGLCPM